MNRFLSYCFSFIVAALLLASCESSSPENERKLMSLKETYSKTDKKPFGGYIARQQLEAMYMSNIIREKKESFDKTWDDIGVYDSSSVYVCITPTLLLNEAEVDAMLDYVSAGNDLFISSGYIDEALTRRIGCKTNYSFAGLLDLFGDMHNTSTTSIAEDSSSFSYYYLPFGNSFSELDNSDTKVLGVNERKNPNFIVHFYGKGKLFLHCDPRAFSNYFLLKDNNYKYMQAALGYTTAQPFHLYWDDYYNKRQTRTKTYKSRSKGGSGSSSSSSSRNSEDDFSTFSEINKYHALALAFWLGLILLLLYILFGGKRRQRIIEKQKPNENTTVTFTETVGRLYLQKKDNKNIAEKMATYFNEFIRNNYFLNTSLVNEEFVTTLSRKSGVERDRIEALYRTIHHAQQNEKVDDYQLLSMNEQIQHFYKTIGSK